jgi:hydrogenase expression/formation protein HypC
MCLAVPMKLVEIHADGRGVAELEGSRHTVDLSLLGEARLGDYVIVHAGFAIETMNQAEADATLALFEELLQESHPEPR